MKRKLSDRLFLYASYLILIFSLITVYANLTDASYAMFLSSDTVGVHLLINDIFFKNADPSGWVLASAPTVFPDLVLYYILRLFTGSNVSLTPFVFSLIQVFVICSLLVYIFRKITDERFRRFDFLIPLFFSLIFLESYFFSSDVLFGFFLCVPSYHCGAFLTALLGLAVFLTDMRFAMKGILLFIISMVGSFSDLLFIVMFIAPFCVTMIFKLRRANYRYNILNLLLVAGGALVGVKLYYFIRSEKIFHFTDPHKIYAFQDIIPSFKLYIKQITEYLTIPGARSFFILFTFVSTIVLSVYAIKNRVKEDSKTFIFTFFALFTAAVLFAPIINGNYSGYDTLRYNVHPFYFSVLILVFSITFLLNRFAKVPAFFAPAILFLFLILPLVKFDKSQLKNYFTHYPKSVQEIDSVKSRFNLKKGIADYWIAKKTTALSHNNVQILSVYPEGNMAELGSNINWYYEGSFNFIVSNGYPKETLDKYFNIKDTVKITDYDILIVEDFYYKKGEYFPSPLKQ